MPKEKVYTTGQLKNIKLVPVGEAERIAVARSDGHLTVGRADEHLAVGRAGGHLAVSRASGHSTSADAPMLAPTTDLLSASLV